MNTNFLKLKKYIIFIRYKQPLLPLYIYTSHSPPIPPLPLPSLSLSLKNSSFFKPSILHLTVSKNNPLALYYLTLKLIFS